MNQVKQRFELSSFLIWLTLIMLTLLTYFIGESNIVGALPMLSLLVISLIKGQLIANFFMGLRSVSWGWRLIMPSYFLLVGGFVALAYLMSFN
jgi:cytochrome c oxidase subunit 4